MTQLPLAFATAASYAPADFMVSDANREAYEWVTNPDSWNSYGLRLCGPAGSGRTHLAHVWAERYQGNFITLPVTEITTNVIIDDATSKTDETALFHVLNLTQAAGKKLLFICDDAPLTRHFKLRDLLSRLNALPHARLHLPDDMLMTAILHKQLADRQLRVSDDVTQYLLLRAPRSFKSLALIVQQLDTQALETKKTISISMVRDILSASTL